MKRHGTSRGLWRWICIAVSVWALAWTIGLLWEAWPSVRATLPKLRFTWLGAAWIGMVLSAYLAFEAFVKLFRQIGQHRIGRLRLGHLYFAGQLMKHLPGRVWGIAYQATAGKAASVAEWLSVNAAFMVLTTGFAVWVAVTTIGFMHSLVYGVIGFVLGLMAYVVGWHRRVLEVGCACLTKIRWGAMRRLGEALRVYASSSTSLKLAVLLLFFASWLVYLGAWALLGMAWPDIGPAQGVVLCALYTVAWLVGYLSLISPSGLGVRELVFAALAHKFPPDVIAGVAIIGRVNLLLIDIVLGTIFLPFGKSDA